MTDHARGAEPSRAGTEAAPTEEADRATPEPSEENDRIEARLSAVERAVTGSDARPADAAAEARATAERERLESRLDDLEDRVAELEAATQAVRGYAGAIRAVNREVERRADLALARATKADRESGRDARIEGVESGASGEGPVGSTVPSESALDAALPDDRPTPGSRSGNSGSSEDDGSGDGGAWAADALDRLRESL